jgi:hypothetical protein
MIKSIICLMKRLIRSENQLQEKELWIQVKIWPQEKEGPIHHNLLLCKILNTTIKERDQFQKNAILINKILLRFLQQEESWEMFNLRNVLDLDNIFSQKVKVKI